MGKSCCCGECCLCDKAWSITDWSVYMLGQNFSGKFLPFEKPIPFTYANNCYSRQGGDCIVHDPVLIEDCREESEWFGTPYNPCCPQCICSGYVEGGSGEVYGYCEILGLLNYEFQRKGVTHTRVWQQESYYGVAQMSQCCDTENSSKTRFTFDFYYHVVRFSSESNQAYTRYRTVAWDCLYDPPMEQATFPDNVVRGEWIQPVEVGIHPPCMPCSWPQSTFFGNCETLSSYECPRCPSIAGCDPTIVSSSTLISIGLIYGCNFTFSGFDGILDSDEPRICRVTDQYKNGIQTVTMASFDGQHCYDAMIGPGTRVYTIEYRYMSDCLDCNNLPSSITLNRINAFPPANITAELFGPFSGGSMRSPCRVLPSLQKVIPYSITMLLTSGHQPSPPPEEI